MKISYLITCCNETDTLQKLLEVLGTLVKNGDDELVIVVDKDVTNNQSTKNLLSEFTVKMGYEYMEKKSCKILEHSLNKDYGAHKNFGIERCSGDFIFQLDGDEMPPESLLGENLHALLESNPTVEAYAIPRINAWIGLTEEHAKQWGWSLDQSPTHKRLRAAWPDYQWRIFKRDYPRISFQKKLHEKIEGYKEYSGLPMDEEYALYHNKTIEKQVETNIKYIKDFSVAENRGTLDRR